MTRSASARGAVALLAVALVGGLVLWPVHAQDDAAKSSGTRSVQDALLKPLTIPFPEPTALETVVSYLKKTLGVRIVLDKAALERLEITSKHEVQLDLEDVRLKTCLKLLLDQVGMTYKVIPEDNLLIFTDQFGAEDPTERALAELKSLHLEMHDLQDAVDEIRQALGLAAGGAHVRKPTIIEQMPDDAGKPVEKPSRPRPGI